MSKEKQTKNEDSGQYPSPEATTGPNKKPPESAGTAEDRRLKIERSVEGIFSKFADETDHDENPPQIIEEPTDIKIELVDDQRAGPDKNDREEKSAKGDGKSYRKIYTAGGIFLLLAVVAAFYFFKAGETTVIGMFSFRILYLINALRCLFNFNQLCGYSGTSSIEFKKQREIQTS